MGRIGHVTSILLFAVIVFGNALNDSSWAQSPPAPATPTTKATRKAHDDKPLSLPPSAEELIPLVPAPVGKWLSDWNTSELAGRSATPTQIDELKTLLTTSLPDAGQLSQIVSLIAYLDGSAITSPLFDLVLERAEKQLNAFQTPDPVAKPLVERLWLFHPVLWDAQEWGKIQKLLQLLRPWESYGSGRSQQAAFQYAESLYLQGRFNDSAVAFNEAEKQRSSATELSDGTNRPADWELGLVLFHGGKYAESLPFLTGVVKANGPEADPARRFLIEALARCGKLAEAEHYWEEWNNRGVASNVRLAAQARAAIEEEREKEVAKSQLQNP